MCAISRHFRHGRAFKAPVGVSARKGFRKVLLITNNLIKQHKQRALIFHCKSHDYSHLSVSTNPLIRSEIGSLTLKNWPSLLPQAISDRLSNRLNRLLAKWCITYHQETYTCLLNRLADHFWINNWFNLTVSPDLTENFQSSTRGTKRLRQFLKELIINICRFKYFFYHWHVLILLKGLSIL